MTINTGDTAWVLISAALVLLMTPALAFFYGGMVRGKSVLNMLMMSFAAMASIGVVWVLWGYSESFGNDIGGVVGNPFTYFGLNGLTNSQVGTVPALAFVAFQATFAIITVALISGAIAERAKFGAWLIFAVIWATLVYFPVAHWVFAANGLGAETGGWIINQLKAIDFAGGTAVHINAGAAGLALALILGKRIGFGKTLFRPHNVPFVMLGAGLLWFGWFGFNAGSALGASNTAAVAWVNTLSATAMAALAWMLVERIRIGKVTSLGAASGVVAGLVAITPACASVNTLGALIIGATAGVLCSLVLSLKYRFGYDDSLDVVGVHLVGGLVGTLLIGLVATDVAPTAVNGLFYGGGLDQLWRQGVAAGAVLLYSFVVAGLIGLVISKTIGFRISKEAEMEGIDTSLHAETAYDSLDQGSFANSSFVTENKTKKVTV